MNKYKEVILMIIASILGASIAMFSSKTMGWNELGIIVSKRRGAGVLLDICCCLLLLQSVAVTGSESSQSAIYCAQLL